MSYIQRTGRQAFSDLQGALVVLLRQRQITTITGDTAQVIEALSHIHGTRRQAFSDLQGAFKVLLRQRQITAFKGDTTQVVEAPGLPTRQARPLRLFQRLVMVLLCSSIVISVGTAP